MPPGFCARGGGRRPRGQFFGKTGGWPLVFLREVLYTIVCFPPRRAEADRQRYRSGHNGTDSKSVDGQPSVGSNPTRCASGDAPAGNPYPAPSLEGALPLYSISATAWSPTHPKPLIPPAGMPPQAIPTRPPPLLRGPFLLRKPHRRACPAHPSPPPPATIAWRKNHPAVN